MKCVEEKLQSKRIVTEQEIDELIFKEALYSYTDKKAEEEREGITDFVTIQKHQKLDFFDFEKYNPVGDPQIWNFFQWMTTIKM